MGNRLRTTYYTRKVALVEPATNTIPGTDNLQEYNMVSYITLGNKRYVRYSHEDWYLDMVMNAEGYTKFDYGDEFYPFYYIKDHLGNIRETYVRTSTNSKYIAQRMQYYPSGLPWETNLGVSEQPFKYGSKEFVEMHGLDEYDSEARWYYPAIMRTTTMDPMCEKYYSTSPYAWCGNNPVSYVDPDGRDWFFTVDSAGTKTYHYSEDITSQHDLDVQHIDGQYVGMTYTSDKYYLGLFGNHAEIDTREASLLKQIDELILKEIDYSLELNAGLIGNEAPTSPRLRFIVPGVDEDGMEFRYAGGKGVYKQVQNNRGYIEKKLEEKRRDGGWFSWTYAYFLIIQNDERYDFLRVQFSDEAAESFIRQYDKYYNRRKRNH